MNTVTHSPQFNGMIIKHYTDPAQEVPFKTAIEVHPSGMLGLDDDEVVLNNESIGRSKALKKISDALANGELIVGEEQLVSAGKSYDPSAKKKVFIADLTLKRRLLGIIQNVVTTPNTYEKLFQNFLSNSPEEMSPVELYHTFKRRFRAVINDGDVNKRSRDNEMVRFSLS